MAVTIANQIENHRGVYFEATGDGATTALVVSHNRNKRPNHSVTATGNLLAGTSVERRSGSGGLQMPNGTAVAISSVSINNTTGAITVNTTAAIANGTKAAFAVVFDQQCGE